MVVVLYVVVNLFSNGENVRRKINNVVNESITIIKNIH